MGNCKEKKNALYIFQRNGSAYTLNHNLLGSLGASLFSFQVPRPCTLSEPAGEWRSGNGDGCLTQTKGWRVPTDTGEVNFHPLRQRRIRGKKKKRQRRASSGNPGARPPCIARDGRDPESGLEPRGLPRLARSPALQSMSSLPAFRRRLLGSSSSFPHPGAPTAALTPGRITCPKIAQPCDTLSLQTSKAWTWRVKLSQRGVPQFPRW